MYPISDPGAKLTKVTRNERDYPVVAGANVMEILASVLDVVTDTGSEKRLIMVREGGQASRTVLGVANKAWIDQEGEFIFNNDNRDAVAMDAIRNSPKTYAIIALTNAMFASRNIRELTEAFSALGALGVYGNMYVVSYGTEVEFRWPDDDSIVDASRTRNDDVYSRIADHHRKRGKIF